jgi:hypothetical protein
VLLLTSYPMRIAVLSESAAPDESKDLHTPRRGSILSPPRRRSQRISLQTQEASDSFRCGSHVFQHPQMNSVNDVVRPKMPVGRGPHGVMVPGGAFQARPPAG